MKTKKGDYLIIGIVVIALAGIYAFMTASSSEERYDAAAGANPIVMTCTDTDGTDISTRGTVTYTVNGVESIFTDECSGDILKEYTCNGDRIASRLQKCNCVDGICV